MSSSQASTIDVLSVQVAALDRTTALSEIVLLCTRPEPAAIVFVNAHSINLATKNPQYAAALRSADLILNDGVGLALAARISGRSFPDNLNGTDLTPRILESAAGHGWTVFLLGGRPGVAVCAARRLVVDLPGLRVVGALDGDFADGVDAASAIRESGADIVLVGMGNPTQELWLAEHLHDSGVRLGVCVGAFLDFASGRVNRAPSWMRRVRIEWLFRLVLEPRRMFSRYVVGIPVFGMRVVRARLRAGLPRALPP